MPLYKDVESPETRGSHARTGAVAVALALVVIAVAVPRTAHAGRIPLPTIPETVAWGEGSYGALGDSSSEDKTTYVAATALPTNVAQVSAGFFHSLAATADGTVWGWGANYFGQLGSGNLGTTVYTPMVIPGLTNIVQVAAGWNMSLALDSTGHVWSWGANDDGDLGQPGVTQTPVPTQVNGLAGITQIAVGQTTSYAVDSNGRLWSWGCGCDGALANGLFDGTQPQPLQVAGLSNVVKISAAGIHAMALTSGLTTTQKTIWAWGGNYEGDLGDGTATNRAVPVAITGINAPNISDIAAGYYFGAALGSDGSVWTWGDNSDGELGGAPVTQSYSPIETLGADTGIVKIAAGGYRIEAILSTGYVESWGAGPLGADIGTCCTTSPVIATGLYNVTQISVGQYDTVAIHRVVSIRF